MNNSEKYGNHISKQSSTAMSLKHCTTLNRKKTLWKHDCAVQPIILNGKNFEKFLKRVLSVSATKMQF